MEALIGDEEGDDDDDEDDETDEEIEDDSSDRGEPLGVMDETLRKMLKGSLESMVPVAKKVVRIFTSSTFTG